MSMIQLLAGGSLYSPQAASTNGSVYIATTTVPTGLSDSKSLTFSGWIYPTDAVTKALYGFHGSSIRVRIRRNSAGTIALFGRNATSTTILDLATTNPAPLNQWTHVYVCMNMANQAASKIYLNGVSETLVVTTFTDDTLDHTAGSGSWSFLSNASGGEIFNGSASEFWFNDVFLDSPSSFYANGRPVDLGPTGSLPSGSQPVWYFSRNGSGNSWAVNAGTAGNMTVTGGTLGSPVPPP